jgi:fatty-acyl-CoA synthase
VVPMFHANAWGLGQAGVMAGADFVMPGADLDADEVRDFLEGRVARWWVPERIEFIEEVPKTSVGKFSKKTLREQFAETKEDAPA